ncbi:S-methyl-5-thioribose kinase [Peribacillus sp. SCS-37]|uniref:S-methyl-5-thioribose kinase n=1 Tax=Paraperibacillus esterisolvens TaxID=3115296 RepID=UPI003905F264
MGESIQAYEPLSGPAAIALVIRLGLFEEGSSLSCSEIGDGNLNYVFHIKDSLTGKGVIIKQALPYAKVVGESWPLTLKRAVIEANALKIFGSFCPELVPEVYYSDEQLAVTVMEDLSRLTIARSGLISGQKYPELSRHIAQYLAKTFFYTSDFFLDPGKKKEFARQFTNPELCKITEDLVFTDPFFNHETNDFEEALTPYVESLFADQHLKVEAAKLKRSFMTEQEVLLHGDLHTGSIFASPAETKVIDPEFAFYGPAGFDLGQYLANLLFQAISRTEDGKGVIYQHLHEVWSTFKTIYTGLWHDEGNEIYCTTPGFLEAVLEKTFRDALGFAGCELIRRTIGLAHVQDLDGIEDDSERLAAKKSALRIGRELILQRGQIDDINGLIKTSQEQMKAAAFS